jgi:tRNA/tmRNA/rRNA uracil-C5-methylase (TrmA/RlmC/RlmD family)
MNLAITDNPHRTDGEAFSGGGTPVSAKPVCAVFGTCGGCRYQDLSYADELAVKQAQVRALFIEGLGLSEAVLDPITPSPRDYGYRTNLDLTFIRTRKDGKYLLGFMKERSKSFLVTIETCPIARPEISAFLPELKAAAAARFPETKRLANLAVKLGSDGRVLWGGIGKRSLSLPPAEYLWADVCGKRVYFSMDTFFQANVDILPAVRERLLSWAEWDPARTFFYDLYAGVGLFGFLMADRVRSAVMIESEGPSMACARHTRETCGYGNVDIREGRTEVEFPKLLAEGVPADAIALVDPPRRGLSPEALEGLVTAGELGLKKLFYLSCGPESLQRDLKDLTARGWSVARIGAFDFFPRTKHIETLALLTR